MSDDWKRRMEQAAAELLRRDDPVALVREVDALDASTRCPYVWPRGPVFGVAALGPEPDARWRLVSEATDGTPQDARDALNSLLWFRAKDEADTVAERRELLAAVRLLECERIDELTVLGSRYRVVRGDEYARCSLTDGPEPPRPTDPEPADRFWGHQPGRARTLPDIGHLLDTRPDDPTAPFGVMAEGNRQALRDFTYEGEHVPPAMRAESREAVRRYPELVLLPVGFGVIKRAGAGWTPASLLQPTPHDARRVVHNGLSGLWADMYDLDTATRDAYARAAEQLEATPHSNEVTVLEDTYRICRVERMLRTGPDGPEPPRSSDPETTEPMRIRPPLDEHGNIQPETETEPEPDSMSAGVGDGPDGERSH
ncbi:hypothetical protein QF026_001750 [Streptomyces aurantiacus]|uniref:DUF5954 family protein n=1 Tax=Streptomyces aurantiacus TaxID=47760 RepID=UPI002791502A|nr:DUF5954 family protein [Streptomyces aurantiacus]MDQ0773284.1 hypothetical protein [Streptomyces aurantiacus]